MYTEEANNILYVSLFVFMGDFSQIHYFPFQYNGYWFNCEAFVAKCAGFYEDPEVRQDVY